MPFLKGTQKGEKMIYVYKVVTIENRKVNVTHIFSKTTLKNYNTLKKALKEKGIDIKKTGFPTIELENIYKNN